MSIPSLWLSDTLRRIIFDRQLPEIIQEVEEEDPNQPDTDIDTYLANYSIHHHSHYVPAI